MNCLVVLSILAFVHVATCWDQGNRDYILNIHNEMRKRPKACEMNKMVYDKELERQAKGWAERCQYRYEIKKGRGENFAFIINDFADTQLIDVATDSWYDEIKMYRYGQNSCGRSCHYSQLVWAKTNKVGCYAHKCGQLVGGAVNAWFLACFYTPVGNRNGERPYKKQCPARCAKGQMEEDGLCVGKAVKECKDTNTSCQRWAKKGQCKRNPNFMKKRCQKSCKAC